MKLVIVILYVLYKKEIRFYGKKAKQLFRTIGVCPGRSR